MSLHFTLYDERILNEGEMSCKLYFLFFCFQDNFKIGFFVRTELEINGGSNEDEEEESDGEDEEGEEELQ